MFVILWFVSVSSVFFDMLYGMIIILIFRWVVMFNFNGEFIVFMVVIVILIIINFMCELLVVFVCGIVINLRFVFWDLVVFSFVSIN